MLHQKTWVSFTTGLKHKLSQLFFHIFPFLAKTSFGKQLHPCVICRKKFRCLRTLRLHRDQCRKNSSIPESKNDKNATKKNLDAHDDSSAESEIEPNHSNNSVRRDDEGDSSDADDVDNTANCHSNPEPEVVFHDKTGNSNSKTVPSFDEAMKYIDLLSSYCSDNAPEGMIHLWPLKTMLLQLEFEKSRRALAELRGTASVQNARHSADHVKELEIEKSRRPLKKRRETISAQNARQSADRPIELDNL